MDSLDSIERAILSGGDGNNVLDTSGFSLGPVELNGGVGNDILIGSSNNDILSSSSGIDQLTGGAGQDMFVLSYRSRFLRSNRENPLNDGDYALITDFDVANDVIELEGEATDYLLGASPSNAPSGQAIYLEVSGEANLIAVIQSESLLDLSASYFSYIANNIVV